MANKLIEFRCADETADGVIANLRARSAAVPIPTRYWDGPAAHIVKTPGVKREYVIVETHALNDDSIMAGQVAAALLEFYPVLFGGCKLTGISSATLSVMQTAKPSKTLLLMARDLPELVSKSLFETRKKFYGSRAAVPSTWEVEMRLTDMTRARDGLVKHGAEVVKCSLSEANTALINLIKKEF